MLSADVQIICLQQWNCHIFDVFSSHAILSIQELHNLLFRSSHSSIILYHYIFKCFDQSSLNVASFGCFDSCIDQSFSASHSVEEELLRSQPLQVAVFDESFTLWTEIILGKVRKRSSVETEGNTFTLNILLTHTSHNLRDIKIRPLGACIDHCFESIVRL